MNVRGDKISFIAIINVLKLQFDDIGEAKSRTPRDTKTVAEPWEKGNFAPQTFSGILLSIIIERLHIAVV